MNVIGDGGVIAPHVTADDHVQSTPTASVAPGHIGFIVTSEIAVPLRFNLSVKALTNRFQSHLTLEEAEVVIKERIMQVFDLMKSTTQFHLLREMFYASLIEALDDLNMMGAPESENAIRIQLDNIAFPIVEARSAGSYWVKDVQTIVEKAEEVPQTDSTINTETDQPKSDVSTGEEPPLSDAGDVAAPSEVPSDDTKGNG